MYQQILIGALFSGAIVFLVTLLVRSFRSSQGCATGCGKCEVADATPKP